MNSWIVWALLPIALLGGCATANTTPSSQSPSVVAAAADSDEGYEVTSQAKKLAGRSGRYIKKATIASPGHYVVRTSIEGRSRDRRVDDALAICRGLVGDGARSVAVNDAEGAAFVHFDKAAGQECSQV